MDHHSGEEAGAASRRWGPAGKASAISFTFDNLGEAADIEFDRWPKDQPIGAHYSAVTVVPELLQRLTAPATFFIEGWNAEVYPDTLKAIAAAGHQVGLHGWRHEAWSGLEPSRRREVLEQGLAAMHKIGLRPRGFRPPGGGGSDDIVAAMSEFGFSHYSALGDKTDQDTAMASAAIASLPFEWPGVDGNHLEASMGGQFNVPPGPDGHYGPAALEAAFRAEIDRTIAAGEHRVFIFHPFIIGTERARLEALFNIIAYAQSKPDVWLCDCETMADWLATQPRLQSARKPVAV